MKHKILSLIGAVVAVSLFAASSVSALNTYTGEHLTVGSDEVIDSSYYGAGNNIVIEGTVNGDVYCAGNSAEIKGTINGDVLCGAMELRIDGTINGDVRSAAQTVVINGRVNGSVTLAGGTVTLEKSSYVERDATIASGTSRTLGYIGRDAMIASGSSILEGEIARNVEVRGEAIDIRGNAMIGGEFVYNSEEPAEIDKNAQILGTISHQVPEKPSKTDEGSMGGVIGGFIVGLLVWIGVIFVTGVLLLLLFPKWYKRSAKTLQENALISIAIGFIGLIGVPVLSFVLLFTVVGSLVSFAIMTLWILALLSSYVFASLALGMWMTGKMKSTSKAKPFVALLVGSLVLTVVSIIPIIGWLIGFIAVLWGAGGLIYMLGKASAKQRA